MKLQKLLPQIALLLAVAVMAIDPADSPKDYSSLILAVPSVMVREECDR